MNKAIVAFSGDPITKGHIDLIRRASRDNEEEIKKLFKKVLSTCYGE